MKCVNSTVFLHSKELFNSCKPTKIQMGKAWHVCVLDNTKG